MNKSYIYIQIFIYIKIGGNGDETTRVGGGGGAGGGGGGQKGGETTSGETSWGRNVLLPCRKSLLGIPYTVSKMRDHLKKDLRIKTVFPHRKLSVVLRYYCIGFICDLFIACNDYWMS